MPLPITWAGGDIITSAWLNTVEKIQALGTYDTATDLSDSRLTVEPNDNFNLIGGAVATNFRLNGSITVGANKYYSWLDARTLTSTISGAGVPYAAILTWDHQTTVGAGCGAYGLIGNIQGVSGAGKISGVYSRISSSGAAFTGTGVAGTFAATSVTGTAWGANSEIVSIVTDTSDLAVGFPVGLGFATNNDGAVLTAAIAILTSVDVPGTVLLWNKRAGSLGNYLRLMEAGSTEIFGVDYLGNLNFAAVPGAAAGQRITGDMTNATLTKRLAFKTSTANSTTIIGAMPSGSGTSSVLHLHNGSDPDNAGRLVLTSNTTNHTLNTAKTGTGTVLGLGLQINAVTTILLQANTDFFLGKTGAATGDTPGHMYVQAVAGAPTVSRRFPAAASRSSIFWRPMTVQGTSCMSIMVAGRSQLSTPKEGLWMELRTTRIW